MGNTLTLEYDTSGNLTRKLDALGNTVVYTYGTGNLLLTETTSGSTGAGAAATQSATTRYVYDTAGKGQLRYVISAQGRVRGLAQFIRKNSQRFSRYAGFFGQLEAGM